MPLRIQKWLVLAGTIASFIALAWPALPLHNQPVVPSLHSPEITSWQQVNCPDSLLQTGDLVVRQGNSFFSNALRKFSQRDQTYSHCGWISRDSLGRLWVYHAIGGTDNPDNSLRKDPLSLFCDANTVNRFAIYHLALSPAQREEANTLAKKYYQERIQFDLQFDLSTDSTLYCSEFIFKILKQTTERADFISLSYLQGKTYVGVDDLYLHHKSKKIFEYAYH